MSRPKCPTQWESHGRYWRQGYEAGTTRAAMELPSDSYSHAAYRAGYMRGLWEYHGISVKRTKCGYAVRVGDREVSRQPRQNAAFRYANDLVLQEYIGEDLP